MAWLTGAIAWAWGRLTWVLGGALAVAVALLAWTHARMQARDLELARRGSWIDTSKRIMKTDQTDDSAEATAWLKERQNAPPES